jgi:hypothetical protein
MKTHPLDTDQAAWTTYTAVLDGMDGAARLYAAIEVSETVREIRLAGIAAEHPRASRREAVARLVLDEFGVGLPGTR